MSFCPFSVGHCIVCSSWIYGFWLPIWYLLYINYVVWYSKYNDGISKILGVDFDPNSCFLAGEIINTREWWKIMTYDLHQKPLILSSRSRSQVQGQVIIYSWYSTVWIVFWSILLIYFKTCFWKYVNRYGKSKIRRVLFFGGRGI